MPGHKSKIESLAEVEARLQRESTALLLGIFENLVMGIYIIENKKITYMNHCLASLFGYAQQQVIGQDAFFFMHPEDRSALLDRLERRLRGESVTEGYSFRGVRKDGQLVQCEAYGALVVIGERKLVIGVVLDVTARIVAERALADQLSFTAELIETIPNPVFYKDVEGRYLGCNRATESFWGRSRADMIGRTAYEVTPGNAAIKNIEADIRLLAHPGSISYEASVIDGQGVVRDVIFNKATFNRSDGSLGGLVGVIIDITERKERERIVRRQAHLDTLTGLPNRRALAEQLEHMTRYADWSRDKLALLFIDLDHFKEVNDSYGHQVGDQLLVDAGMRIRAGVRVADHVFRLGGDEFVAMIGSPYKQRDPLTMARRILHELARPFEIGDLTLEVTASIGIATAPQEGSSGEELLHSSDQAMYLAKARGRNCVCWQGEPLKEHTGRKKNG